MYVICLATDYDGTLAHDGVVDSDTVDALVRLKRSGRKLVLVTGRELPDLSRFFRGSNCSTGSSWRTARSCRSGDEAGTVARPRALAGVRRSPEGEGRRAAVGRALDRRHLGAERNRGAGGDPRARARIADRVQQGRGDGAAAGVNKASGLAAALDDLGLSPHNVVAVGDAENDHAFMQASGFAAAVANALPAVKEEADLVTAGASAARAWRS